MSELLTQMGDNFKDIFLPFLENQINIIKKNPIKLAQEYGAFVNKKNTETSTNIITHGLKYRKIKKNWFNNVGLINPVNRIKDVVKEYGYPDSQNYNTNKYGHIIWSKENLGKKKLKEYSRVWERIEIRDESIIHKSPSSHNDFLYSWFKLDEELENYEAELFRKMSKSTSYDPLKKEVRARCHFMGANAITIWLLVFKIKENEENEYIPKYGSGYEDVNEDNIEEVYKINIAKSTNYNNYKVILNDLKEFRQLYSW
jgi:hypothetical protein